MDYNSNTTSTVAEMNANTTTTNITTIASSTNASVNANSSSVTPSQLTTTLVGNMTNFTAAGNWTETSKYTTTAIQHNFTTTSGHSNTTSFNATSVASTNGTVVATLAPGSSKFVDALTTYLDFFGLLLPTWGVILAGVILFILLVIFVVVCYKSYQAKAAKSESAGKAAKSSVVPLDTTHLLDYPGSVHSFSVQPEGSEIELEHRSNSTLLLREKRFLGSLKYSVQYDMNKNELRVGIQQAADLSLAVPEDAVNPFCKVYLYPDKDKKSRFETPVEMGSTNPVFNQTYTFSLPFSDLLDKTLVIAVWNAASAGQSSMIGQVRIPVGAIDINKPIVDEWRDLEVVPDIDDDASHGDVCISLRYVPTTTKLTVVVLECKNLRRKTDMVPKACDPFLKLKLRHNSKILKSKRTSVKKRTFNPYYNEEFTFLVPPDLIHKCHMVVTVCVYETVVGARKIGKIVLGANVSGSGAQHWNEMVSSPRKPIVQWHRVDSAY